MPLLTEGLNITKRMKPIEYTVTDTNCWKVTSHKDKGNGYTRVHRNGNFIFTHRYAYELMKGSIPDGMVVLHSCDNRKCVNPEHLRLGTQSDNMADMHSKNRHTIRKGRTRPVSEEDKKAIRNDTRPIPEIAKSYGRHPKTIEGIKRAKPTYAIKQGGN